MSAAGVAILVLAVAAVAGVAGYLLAGTQRRREAEPQESPGASTAFVDLPESERCDLVFALASLDNPGSHRLLERALDDPSEAVAIAAARAMAACGRTTELEPYLARPDERSRRIAHTLELLA